MLTLFTSIQLEVLERIIQQGGEKRHPSWKEETRLSIFIYDVITYVETLMASTKKATRTH